MKILKRKTLAALLALSLLASLLPLGAQPALAVDTAPQTLYVGSTIISTGYWTSSDGGKVWTSPADEPEGNNYIHYDGQGTLKLHNVTIQGASNAVSAPFGSGIYALSSSNQPVALTIKLIGENTITGDMGIYVAAEASATSYGTDASLTITSENNGSLQVSGLNYGIYVKSGTGNASINIKNVAVTSSTNGNSAAGVYVMSSSTATNSPQLSLAVNGGSLTASGTESSDGIWFYVGSSQAIGATTSLTVSDNAIVRANGGIKASRVNELTPSGTGIVFDGSAGTVYGNVTLQKDLEIKSGETLTVPEGSSLNCNRKLTNNGTIRKGTFTKEVINESSGAINGGTFTGTITNNDGTVSGGDFSKATLNGMLVITFDPDNGDQSITQKVDWSKDGAALTAPASTNEGHSLDGWYYDNNGTETKWNFDMDTVKCTMTLKAKWELSTYSVTLQTDGGTIASGKEVTGYTYGTGAVLPTAADITREGYRFDGWYADSSFSSSPITEISATETGNKTFYAKWTKNTTPIVPGNNTSNIVEQYKTDDSSSGEQTDREVPSPVVKNTTSYLTYTVQAGDTLWKIARKYSCSVAGIVAANSDRIKNPNRIHAGWQLKIPQSGAPITGGTPDAVLPENKKSGRYIVRQGDTLWAIARKYGCSVAEIISLNRELIRDPALIYSGWELKVPQN